jgi:hypothetical protein
VKRYIASGNNIFFINPNSVIHSHSNIRKEVTWKYSEKLRIVIVWNVALASIPQASKLIVVYLNYIPCFGEISPQFDETLTNFRLW